MTGHCVNQWQETLQRVVKKRKSENQLLWNHYSERNTEQGVCQATTELITTPRFEWWLSHQHTRHQRALHAGFTVQFGELESRDDWSEIRWNIRQTFAGKRCIALRGVDRWDSISPGKTNHFVLLHLTPLQHPGNARKMSESRRPSSDRRRSVRFVACTLRPHLFK